MFCVTTFLGDMIKYDCHSTDWVYLIWCVTWQLTL